MAREVALPYRTDWRQMAAILDYAKGKGVDRAALEARFGAGEAFRETCNGLEQLGLIDRDDSGSVTLTDDGRELAYAPDARRQRELLLRAMLRYAPYRMPLERALAEQQAVIDGPWVEHIWQIDMRLSQPRNRAEEARTVFFRLADDAGLGVYRRGVRGQTTRFELATEADTLLAPLLAPPPQPAPVPTPAPAASAAASAPAPSAPDAAVAATQQAPPVADAGQAVRDNAQAGAKSPLAASATGVSGVAFVGLPPGMSVHVDLTAWDIDKIAAFLRLIGYPTTEPGSGSS